MIWQLITVKLRHTTFLTLMGAVFPPLLDRCCYLQTLRGTSLFALDTLCFRCTYVSLTSACITLQVVWETAESSWEGPPESLGEGGLRHAVWRLHEPERQQGERDIWNAGRGGLAQSSDGTRAVEHERNAESNLIFNNSTCWLSSGSWFFVCSGARS